MTSLARIQHAEESFTLVRYQAMCTAIAECHRVDEATDIRDKARALEVYYQQANNTEAERKAIDIRLRAERRAGELLKDLARMDVADAAVLGGEASGKSRAVNHVTDADTVQIGSLYRQSQFDRPIPKSEYAQTLDDLGMSRQKAHRFQQLAAVPQETFEAALADPIRQPSAAAIVRQVTDPVKPIDANALRLWGKLRDFERHGDGACDPAKMLHEMTETMRRDVARLVHDVADYWQRFSEVVRNECA